MNARAGLGYCAAVTLLVFTSIGSSTLGAWDCCDTQRWRPELCTRSGDICCYADALEPCYDTWLPFDELAGYCMTFEQCQALAQ